MWPLIMPQAPGAAAACGSPQSNLRHCNPLAGPGNQTINSEAVEARGGPGGGMERGDGGGGLSILPSRILEKVREGNLNTKWPAIGGPPPGRHSRQLRRLPHG
jgi:hypothetical protein